MKKVSIILLAAMLLFSLLSPALATIGRDILLISRHSSSWVFSDTVVVLLADGTRLMFDITSLPQEIKDDVTELLYFLRVHALSQQTLLYDAPPPQQMQALEASFAQQVRNLLAKTEDQNIETQFYAFDAGSTLLYGVVQREGEGKMLLLAEGGTYIGQSTDPTAAEIIALAGPVLMME